MLLWRDRELILFLSAIFVANTLVSVLRCILSFSEMHELLRTPVT